VTSSLPSAARETEAQRKKGTSSKSQQRLKEFKPMGRLTQASILETKANACVHSAACSTLAICGF
jgi:hypothetical protein